MNLIKKNEIFLLEEIVKKNFSSKYKDSILGIFWTILNPLLMMALFTIIFSTIFNRNIVNFPIYFLTGWCTFMYFTNSISTSMMALKGNKNILQKTPAPKYIFVIGAIISEFLNFLVMLLLLIIIMIITHAPFYWTMVLSIIPIISLSILISGIGFILSIACVYYTDIKHLWTVLSMVFMYASGIFYPMDIIPEPFRSYITTLNPLYWTIDQFRCFIYLGQIPGMHSIINFILISLIILVFGVIMFKKYENKVTLKL